MSLDDLSDVAFVSLCKMLRQGVVHPVCSIIRQIVETMESAPCETQIQFLKDLKGRSRVAAIAVVKHIAHNLLTDQFHLPDFEAVQKAMATDVEYGGIRMPFMVAKQAYEWHMLHMCKCYNALDTDLDFFI